jgi:hypothetical protein
MMKLNQFGIIGAAMLFSAWASAGHLPSNAIVTVTANSGTECQSLLAGQTIEAGTVCYDVDNSGDAMTVTFDTTGGWELTEAHLWVGDSPEGYPSTPKGNPKVGNFPYNSGNISGATNHIVTVSLAGWHDLLQCDESLTLYSMAHAAVRKEDGSGGYQTETGWAAGDRVTTRGSWATQVTLDIGVTCEDVPPPPPPPEHDHETAFAVSTANALAGATHFTSALSTCFLDIDIDGDMNGDFSRWGWTNGDRTESAMPLYDEQEFVGLSAGSYSFDIYAGAGKCDLSKGTLVGTLGVEYNGSTAVVTYTANNGYHFDEAHLYVGNDILAIDNGSYTVAPGQYQIVEEFDVETTSVTYTVGNLSGTIFVVAHGVAGPF